MVQKVSLNSQIETCNIIFKPLVEHYRYACETFFLPPLELPQSPFLSQL